MGEIILIKTDEFIRKARITNVVDGDTFDATVDLGFHTLVTHRFRMLELDTPERNKKGYKEATAFTSKHILDKDVFIQSVKTDVYGRYLAHVLIGDTTLSAMLVEEGLAEVYDYHKRKKGYK